MKLKPQEMDRLGLEDFRSSDKFPLILIADNIRSGNNIGSLFRSSDALRTEAVYLCGISAKPPHRDIQKTALGATESVEWQYFENTVDAVAQAREKGYKVYALEQTRDSILLNDFRPSSDAKIAIVLGNEVRGVDQKVIDDCDGVIEIPQFGTKHSFNVSVSAGIILWDLFTKIRPFESL